MEDLARRYRVTLPEDFRLADRDAADTAGMPSKKEGRERLEAVLERLTDLQERLYAQDRWALLVVLQGMDAAGKDGVIRHVLGAVNPLGCQIFSFKAPSEEELDHDYLWRVARRLPERGRIGIFNRSHYEEVLVVRVHPELLECQKLPPALRTEAMWRERFEDINGFERFLSRNGVALVKCFLHVSRQEQCRRLLGRLDDPAKQWKFSMGDVAERTHWAEYQRAYEECVRQTSTPWAPWHVVPADHKWVTRLVVASAIVEVLEGLGLEFPLLDETRLEELGAVRRALAEEAEAGRAD